MADRPTRAARIAAELLADTDLLTPNHDGTPEHYAVAADDVEALVARVLELADAQRERRVMQTLPPRSMDIHLSPPAPHPVTDPCAVGIHQYAWRTAGGMQCVRCGGRP